MRVRRALGALASAVLVSAVVSGCQGLNPGVAVRVADQTIGTERVAAAADALCEVSTKQLQQRGQVIPMSLVNQQVVRLLTLRSIAEQVAAAYGVAPSAEYRQARATAQQELDSLSTEATARMVELATTQPYVNGVVLAVGRQELAAQGTQDVSQQEATRRGNQVLADWVASHEIEVAPRYGLVWQQGRLRPAGDAAGSYPVSELATMASDGTPSTGYTGELPARLRCGDA